MLITSDFHFENWGLFAKPWMDGCNTRLRNQLSVLDEIFSLAVELDETNIIHLGDWFDKWGALNTPLASMVTSHLYHLLNKCPQIYLWMLVGNHDMPHKREPGINTITAYSAHPRIRLIDSPEGIVLEGMVCAFIPYHEDHAEIFKAVTILAEDRFTNVLFSHLDIVGARTGLDGKSWKSDRGLDIPALSMFNLGIFGHYHVPQSLTIDDRFRFVGSPTQISWVEANTGPRYVLRLYNGKCQQFQVGEKIPRFVKFDAEDSVQNLRASDYHAIVCDAQVAREVRKQYTAELEHVVIMARKETPSLPTTMEHGMGTDEDVIKTWVMNQDLCESEKARLLAYSLYYAGEFMV